MNEQVHDVICEDELSTLNVVEIKDLSQQEGDDNSEQLEQIKEILSDSSTKNSDDSIKMYLKEIVVLICLIKIKKYALLKKWS